MLQESSLFISGDGPNFSEGVLKVSSGGQKKLVPRELILRIHFFTITAKLIVTSAKISGWDNLKRLLFGEVVSFTAQKIVEPPFRC